MTHRTQRIRTTLIGLALVAALTSSFNSTSQAVVDADLSQAPICAWDSGARMSQSLYYMASAYDFNEDVVYAFGGLNKDFDVQNFMQAIEFAGAAGPGDGETSTKRNGTARLFGASAFYRPGTEAGARAGTKGTIYVLFGSKDPGTPTGSGESGGAGENTVFAYDIETNAWRLVTTGGGALGERLFAAAAYDPVNDVAVVTGGVKQCSIAAILAGTPCDADAFETLILSFDESGNISVARGPSGGPRTVHGHSMSYDMTSGRMLVHGGTTNGDTTTSNTWVLEMGDLTTLSWDRTGSGGPSLVGHSAAYWPGNEWLIVHGGASNAPSTTRENVSTKTYGLMFDPTGETWGDLAAATSPTERMAASAEYVDNGEWQGVVVMGGRTRFNVSGSSVAANYNVLICEGAAPVQTPTAPPMTATAIPTATSGPGTPDPTEMPTETAEPGTPDPTEMPTETPDLPTSTPTDLPPTATLVPVPTATPVPLPTTDTSAEVCPGVAERVPASVIAAALGSPDSISGWNERCNPNAPQSPWNTLRTYLTIRNIGAPYHPVFNGLVYTCGCR